jgi:hypothetical protein
VKAADDGTFQFLAVPPGHYEVHFLTRGGKRPGPHKPHRPGHGRHRPAKPGQVVEITVKAMEATHVNWPAQNPVDAEPPEEVEDLDPADA